MEDFYTTNIIQDESPYWPEIRYCDIKMYWCCTAGNWQPGPPKPGASDSSSPGEIYPQKWCTTLWVNKQNMMYGRAGIKREALKRQPAMTLCQARIPARMQSLFMLQICRLPHYFCFYWPALMPERRRHVGLHAQKQHRQAVHRCHNVKHREQKFAQGISTCG